MGGWVERGGGADPYKPLDDFRAEGNGRTEYVLKNLYVYFWRWGTWKVFDANKDLPNGDVGIVCYITTSGYLRGAGFKGMREYLRRNTSEGWIIDVSPEGQRPEVATRIFPGVQQPLAIALFTRTPDCDRDTPAAIHYTAVHGRRAKKYQQLVDLTLTGSQWRQARTKWQAPLTPAADTDWDDYPALNDLLPWSVPGVKANRNWVSAPAPAVLKGRLKALVAESNPSEMSRLFKDTRDRSTASKAAPLPGIDTEQKTNRPFTAEGSAYIANARIVRYGYRSFDRQWLIADNRLLDYARPPMWAARIERQLFVFEQHAHPIADGPGLTFSSLIPDVDYFNGRGGRTMPLLHSGGRPNLAKGLLDVLTTLTGHQLTAPELVAYLAGVTAHPGFTEHFIDELGTPGIRVPITTDASLFQRAIGIGREVIWLHTYAEAFADHHGSDIRYSASDPRRITNLTAVNAMPTAMIYDPDAATIYIGAGSFGPVAPAVWDYTVGGREILKSWFNYRKANPTGRRTSPLDGINATTWPTEWNGELIDLLSALSRLVDLEPAQAELLDAILAKPLASRADLATAGVTWPGPSTNDAQRRPNAAPVDQDQDDQDVDGQLGFTFGGN